MEENEIRPAEMFDEYLRLSAEDVERFFSEKNKRLYRKCPGCGEDQSQKAFDKNNFDLVWCDGCDSLYVNPCPDPNSLAKFYLQSPSQKFWANTFFPLIEGARKKKIFQPRAENIKKLLVKHHMPRPTRIIDVGAGTGAMLEELSKVGMGEELFAIEPGPWQAKDIFVFKGFVEDAAKDQSLVESASLVMSFEVIEHVISPLDFLNNLSILAKPGGIILVTGLCGSGFDIKVLGKNSKAVSPPHHLNFLTKKGISTLLNKCGLQELSFTTPGVLDIDIVSNSFAEDPTTVSDPFLRQLFSNDDKKVLSKFQEFITCNNLSSHMWVLARKPG